MDGEHQTRNVVVFAVHGTFAPHAPWTQQASSSMYEYLLTALTPHRVNLVWVPIPWSGQNTLLARQMAAKGLVEAYNLMKQTLPDAQFVAVGHSHGGSVVAYAMAADGSLTRDLSAVFLSTPFIDLKVRPGLADIISVPVTFVGYATVLAILLSGVWMQIERFLFDSVALLNYIPVADIEVTRIIGVGIAVIFPIVAVLLLVHRWLCAIALRKCGEYEKEFSTTGVRAGQHLFVRCVGDEATAALAAGQFANWALARVFDRALSVMRWFDLFVVFRKSIRAVRGRAERSNSQWRFLKFFFWIVLCSVAASMTVKLAHDHMPENWRYALGSDFAIALGTSDYVYREFLDLFHQVTTVPSIGELRSHSLRLLTILVYSMILGALFAVITCVILYGIGILLLGLVALLLIGVFRSFGKTAVLRNLLMDISVEPVPLGDVTLTQLNWDDVGRGRLNHSAAYENPHVQKAIASWILRRLTSANVL